MHRLASIAVVCVIFVTSACDRDMPWLSKHRVCSNSLATPEEVVKVFCDMDAAGKILSSLTWPELLPYINWREEAMESAAVVISSFKLTSIKETAKAAEILVQYSVVGKYDAEKLMPVNFNEKVLFKVIKTDTGWKIDSPETMVPHVLSTYMIAHLERVLKKPMMLTQKKSSKIESVH